MRRPSPREVGYPDPLTGKLIPEIEEYLVAEVREQYVRDEISPEVLAERMGAALRGDYKGAGLIFMPMRLETQER